MQAKHEDQSKFYQPGAEPRLSAPCFKPRPAALAPRRDAPLSLWRGRLALAQRVGTSFLCGRARCQGQIRDSNLDVGRAVPHCYVRSQARRRLRLLRSAEESHRYECGRHHDRRTVAAAGQTSGQVLDHSRHDARQLRARDGVVLGADGPRVWWAGGLSFGRGGDLVVQGVWRGLCRFDSALRRLDRTTGAILGGGFSGLALQTLCYRRRPGRQPLSGRRHYRAWYLGPTTEGAARIAAPVEYAWPRLLSLVRD